MILKGIILYFTFFMMTITILGIDSIVDKRMWYIFLIDVIYVLICNMLISKEEFETLTLYNMLKSDEDE